MISSIITQIFNKAEFHLRVLSVPTVSASFPDGWTDSDVTAPLQKEKELGKLLYKQDNNHMNVTLCSCSTFVCVCVFLLVCWDGF